MKRCPRCGTANEMTSNYCSHCGLSLAADESPTIGDGTPHPDSQQHPDEPKRRSRKVTAALTIVTIILLGCVAFFVWALTPTGQSQMSEFATWAATEATRQAGE